MRDVLVTDVDCVGADEARDVGNQSVANGQLDIAANSVLAVVFSVKIQ